MRAFRPLLVALAGFVVVLLALACASGSADPQADSLHAAELSAPPPGSSLEAFIAEHDFLDGDRWMSIDIVPSAITQTRRRVYFEKDKVASALLIHAGGQGEDAAPMEYPRGTVFVTRALDDNGAALDTEILITAAGSMPKFLVFDEHGERTDVFIRPVGAGENGTAAPVPQSCTNCHRRNRGFHPTYSYPDEHTAGDWRIVMPEAWRDRRAVDHFRESQRGGYFLFGPYGAILFGRLRAEAAAGTLSDDDAVLWEMLAERFPDLAAEPTPESAS